jgi:hypothetical protein
MIALKVIDYTDSDIQAGQAKEPKWTLRTLGVDTSVNHTSKTQVNGLRQRLEELSRVFNESPFAKRHNLRFVPDDFAYRLIGTSGDHAADQKRCHAILQIWRLEVIMQQLGEEALFGMDVTRMVALLVQLKGDQIIKYGGQEVYH